MKLKEFGLPGVGGGCVPHAPLDPPLMASLVFSATIMHANKIHQRQYRSQLLSLLESLGMPSMWMVSLADPRGHQGCAPPGVQIILFSYSFRLKYLKIIALLGVSTPPRENPGFATGFVSTYKMNGICLTGFNGCWDYIARPGDWW